MNNIKDYRSKELLWYIIAQILLVIVFQNSDILKLDFDKMIELATAIVSSTLTSSVIGVMSFVFDSIFSDELKSKLLYFGFKRPGECVFENIKNKHCDFRYTKERAMDAYKEIYENMPNDKKRKKAYQNDQWYKIFSKHQDFIMVSNSHRDYLLCRDIYFATIMVVVFYVLISILLVKVTFSWKLLVFEFVLLLVSNFATRQRGKRFVSNVIARDLQSK